MPFANQVLLDQPGVILFAVQDLTAANHRHHALQLNIERGFENNTAKVTWVRSDLDHKLTLNKGLVVLLDPETVLAEEWISKFSHTPELMISWPTGETPQSNWVNFKGCLKELGLTDSLGQYRQQDPRVVQVLLRLQASLANPNVYCEDSWRAVEVAKSVHLSESRFLHLFKAATGITWRGYLLWQRLLVSISALVQEKSATDAAQLGGFADSAHLSRTFKDRFGLTIREAVTLFTKGQ